MDTLREKFFNYTKWGEGNGSMNGKKQKNKKKNRDAF